MPRPATAVALEPAARRPLAEDLVRLIRSKPFVDADLHAAKLLVLDTVACAIGGRHAPPAQSIRRTGLFESHDVGRRAFLFGALAHMLELDDLHRASVTHPACVVIPAAWAVAAERGLGGRAFLQAVLHGYEACTRVGLGVGKAHYRVWHNTSTCGPFGSAMAAASLLGLDEQACVWALGNAGTQSSGFWEFLWAGAMSKHLHTGRAAESGVLAALLAREGFTGPPTILEGDKGFFRATCPDAEPDAVLREPDAAWQVHLTSIKPWPCCRHTHPAIDAALGLVEELGEREVASVEVETYRAALDVCDRLQPAESYGAKFSLQHCVAAALHNGVVDLATFEPGALPVLSRERVKVALRTSPRFDDAYPGAWGASVRVRTVDGAWLHCERASCKGDPGNPVGEAELIAKARALILRAGLAEAATESLIGCILALEQTTSLAEVNLYDVF